MEIAEWYKEENEPELAIGYYEKAVDTCSMQDDESMTAKCQLAAADLMVFISEYSVLGGF